MYYGDSIEDHCYISHEKISVLEKQPITSCHTVKTKSRILTPGEYVKRVFRTLRLIRCCDVAIFFAKAFIPSFVPGIFVDRTRGFGSESPSNVLKAQSCHRLEPSLPKHKSVHCLDGLRGLACLVVFNFHFLYPWTQTIIIGYGTSHPIYDEKSEYVHQLPFLSLLYRGRAMVTVFFTISGYVLSRRILILIRHRDLDRGRKRLASSVFRRALRLYQPPIMSLFVVMIASNCGLFDSENEIYSNQRGLTSRFIFGQWEQHPPIHASSAQQLRDWLQAIWVWADPFSFDRHYNAYDPHTWTIPVEFRTSLLLFAALMGTAGMRTIWRQIVTCGLAVYCMMVARWEVAVFLSGMLLCERDLINDAGYSADDNLCGSDHDTHHKIPIVSGAQFVFGKGIFKMTVLLGSLYILSFPDYRSELSAHHGNLSSRLTPAIYTSIQNDYLFWHSLASIPLVWSVLNTRCFRTFFETRALQYLGRVSFSFYLVHGPILHSFGFRLMPAIWSFLGYEGKRYVDGQEASEAHSDNWLFVSGLAIGYPVLLCASIWVADIFWRFVDIPCTSLARRIEKFVSVSDRET